MAEPRWLTDDEQRSWRAFLAVHLMLPDQLSRELQRQHGLTHADYEILVHLSESDDSRLRMSDLAAKTLSSKSRLSHQISRMEEAGLVERVPCTRDRRGFWAVLTDTGWKTLTEAAPDHVESVRAHLVDVLTPEQFAQFGQLCRIVADHLQKVHEPG